VGKILSNHENRRLIWKKLLLILLPFFVKKPSVIYLLYIPEIIKLFEVHFLNTLHIFKHNLPGASHEDEDWDEDSEKDDRNRFSGSSHWAAIASCGPGSSALLAPVWNACADTEIVEYFGLGSVKLAQDVPSLLQSISLPSSTLIINWTVSSDHTLSPVLFNSWHLMVSVRCYYGEYSEVDLFFADQSPIKWLQFLQWFAGNFISWMLQVSS
jgi:hypothetical protein